MSQNIRHVAALTLAAAAALACSGAAGFAHTAVVCTGTRPEYNPGDLLYKRAAVDASARLALAIRWREYRETCHRVDEPGQHHHG